MMWLKKCDLGILDIFSENAVYTESWGPEYHGPLKIKLWFDEWNRRGTVLQWDIKQYFHKGNQTVVDGILKIRWTMGRLKHLMEFLSLSGRRMGEYNP